MLRVEGHKNLYRDPETGAIVNLVNSGMSPDQAAETVAMSFGASGKLTDKLDQLVKQKIASKMPIGLLESR